MTTFDIHILIEQGLNNIGSFAYADFEHDEIDLAYNDIVYEEIREVFRDIDQPVHANNFERNQYYTDYLSVLKNEHRGSGNDEDEYQSLSLPDDYLHLVNDTSIVVAKNCKGKDLIGGIDKLKPNKYYKAVDDVKYNLAWYKKCEIFQAGEETSFYGKVEEIPVKKVANRLLRSENIYYLLNSKLSKTQINSPVSELMGNELRVYKKNFDIASIDMMYIRKPLKISYNSNMNEVNEFREDIVRYFIRKTVQYLSIRSEQSQQKISNLKAENFENL